MRPGSKRGRARSRRLRGTFPGPGSKPSEGTGEILPADQALSPDRVPTRHPAGHLGDRDDSRGARWRSRGYKPGRRRRSPSPVGRDAQGCEAGYRSRARDRDRRPKGKRGQCATHRADGVGSRVARASRHPAGAIWQCAALQSQPRAAGQSVLDPAGLHGSTTGRCPARPPASGPGHASRRLRPGVPESRDEKAD